ncbi:MAG: CHAD domain-containing protein [Rhodospirillales bacterium]|nr:CHAD domain-containing protein [Rhodospirillales bacterium]
MSGNHPALVLSFDSEAFSKLKASPRLAALAAKPPVSGERWVSRFDGPGFELAAQGLGLAVSRDDGGAAMQILTSEAERHGRWQSPLPGNEPLALPAEFQALELLPFAIETLAYQSHRLALGRAGLRLDLEAGRIEALDRSQPVFRAVIGGPAMAWRRLVALARLLMGDYGGELMLAEGDMALALAQGTLGRARKSRRMGLHDKIAKGDALRLIARLCIGQIAANRPVILDPGGDTVEGVHQMRVGVRRLRSAINLFRPLLKPALAEKVTAELKELAAQLGPVRDADVFQEVILDPALAQLPGHPGLERLKNDLEAKRVALLGGAFPAIGGPRFSDLMLTLLDWSETGVSEGEGDLKSFAVQALEKRHRKLMKAGRDFLNLDPALRHQLRIRGKKMRYAAEFLHTLFGEGKARRYLESLTNLVDVLGHLNDIAVARRVLEEKRSQDADNALHHGIGFAEGWHAGRAALLEEQAIKAWTDFKRQDKFWK